MVQCDGQEDGKISTTVPHRKGLAGQMLAAEEGGQNVPLHSAGSNPLVPGSGRRVLGLVKQWALGALGQQLFAKWPGRVSVFEGPEWA